MVFNERKAETLDYFSRREWTRPAVYAIDNNFYPIRASYSYLKRLHRWHYIRRAHDATGHLVYRLGPKGAKWLLRGVKSPAS